MTSPVSALSAGRRVSPARNSDDASLAELLARLDAMVYRCHLNQPRQFQALNDACAGITGMSRSMLLAEGRNAYDALIHVEDRERFLTAIADAAAISGRYSVDYRLNARDGTRRWVTEKGVVVTLPDGDVVMEGIVEDITERKAAEVALQEAEKRYHSLFENAIEGIFRTTPDGHYLDANPALARIYGFDSPEALIEGLRDISRDLYVEPQRRDEFMRIIRARGAISGFESQVQRRDGSVIWISENARAVFDDEGTVTHYEGTVEDITELKRYQSRIEHQASYDALTGLANRSLLKDRLQQAILAAAGYGTRLAVVFADLDRFKLINDSLGHHVGDELLRVMAQRFTACVREYDTVARLGGDEFVLILNGQGEPGTIGARMKRVLEVASQPWRTAHGDFQLTCSLGVALYPDDGADAATLLRHADSAMYRAKERGRGNIQFFTPELNARITERLELESSLRRALERGQFRLHYQPRVDLATRRIVGCEALVRWQIPGRGIIGPDRFIPIAEETGLIAAIGRWVLDTACVECRSWQLQGLAPMTVSVNVSARQFRQPDFVQTVADALHRSGLDPQFLELELTESVVMHDAEHIIATLREIKNLGVQIAVDDFGTGYSSLSYLKRFPVDRLKVDGSFVDDIATDTDDAAIVRTIIALGHSLGLKVVAERVETGEQLEFLRNNACDEVQGFYFYKPMPADEFRALQREGEVQHDILASSIDASPAV